MATKSALKRKLRELSRHREIVRVPRPEADNLAKARQLGEQIAEVLMNGQFAALSAEQRVSLHNGLCKSLGLNPLTKPFDYIQLNGKWIIYANKSCAEQLRKIHGVSVISHEVTTDKDLICATVQVQDKTGRTDFATGCVPLPTGPTDRANAIMKASTKAKRRATLSICGLGFVDESELDTVEVTGGFTPQGREWRYESIEQEAAHNPSLKRYIESETHTPAQQEVIARRLEELKSSAKPETPQPSPTIPSEPLDKYHDVKMLLAEADTAEKLNALCEALRDGVNDENIKAFVRARAGALRLTWDGKARQWK